MCGWRPKYLPRARTATIPTSRVVGAGDGREAGEVGGSDWKPVDPPVRGRVGGEAPPSTQAGLPEPTDGKLLGSGAAKAADGAGVEVTFGELLGFGVDDDAVRDRLIEVKGLGKVVAAKAVRAITRAGEFSDAA